MSSKNPNRILESPCPSKVKGESVYFDAGEHYCSRDPSDKELTPNCICCRLFERHHPNYR